MWHEIIRRLRSNRVGTRLSTWEDIRTNLTELRAAITGDVWRELHAIFTKESDEDVWRRAASVMIGLGGPPGTFPRDDGRATSDANHLVNWLWLPFKDTSAVLGLTEDDFRRRDEVAMIPLARHLGWHEFPNATIRFMEADDSRWDPMLFHERFRSLCFVGRLGIFGKEAAQRWKDNTCRFGFAMDRRPKGLKAGELHPEYHCITERMETGSPAFHHTEECDGVRIDYGLIQRYSVSVCGRPVQVVACAGGSSLGTLAAATWATSEISEPLHANELDPLPTPLGLNSDSRLEALVQVKAAVTSHAWEPDRIELLKLHAGRNVWSVADAKWHAIGKTPIELRSKNGEVVEVRIDGERARLQKGSQAFRVLVKMLENATEGGGDVVDVARLAKDKSIWGGKTRDEPEVRHVLSTLKHRYLTHSLKVERDAVTLDAEITKVDKIPPQTL